MRNRLDFKFKTAAVLCLLVALWLVKMGTETHATAEPTAAEWVFVPGPDLATTNGFRGVAALSSDDVWAVGQRSNLTTLTAHWDSTAWTVIPSPNAGTINSTLLDVAAVAPNDVWAVGYYVVSGGSPQTLVEHWDGTAWSIVPSPYIMGGTSFKSVAVVSANDIWAVGNRVVGAPGPTTGTLTAHWDGSSWEIVPSPNVGTRSNDLNSITVISPNDMWAVGYSRNLAGNYESLALHWDGSNWTVASTPTGPAGSELFAVDGVSANDVWATGIYYDGTGGTQPHFLHWTGSSWASVTSPGGGSGLAAIAGNDVWAVGGTFSHWDGIQWSLVPGAQPPGGTNVVPRALSALSSTEVWAVGSYSNGVATIPLTERWQETGPVTPTPVPTATSTAPPTAIPTSTPTQPAGTATSTAVSTSVATATATPTATATVAPCTVEFSDVPPGSTFYDYIRCLACRGIVIGYSDGTFRPNVDVTRGQAAKIVTNSAGYDDPIPPTTQTFTDVPPGHPFWLYVERAALHGVIGGYSDGTYRPANNMTRGQLAKVTSEAAEHNDPIPLDRQTFSDVPVGSTFWVYIERLALHGIVGGYSDGTFRPNNNVTRGQTSKIVSNAFFPECGTR
ncbi:MAG TPA: S-layer homology domain-containing protein [Chloroflexia bacterium]|nr:S-layer homology domain-containing protein [Chloroflexia bacterium]